MLYLGTDEAGYGPNLGPLVVTASLWQVAETTATGEFSFYEKLNAGIAAKKHATKIAIADSKQLYTSGSNLLQLERGLLAALKMRQACPKNIIELCQQVHCTWDVALPWQADFHLSSPVELTPDELAFATTLLQNTCAAQGVTLLNMQAALVQPQVFNQQCRALGNKAALLSATALGLVRESLLAHPTESMHIVCDKHGGRNKYAALLMSELLAAEGVEHPFALVTVMESREQSIYRWKNMAGGAREIRFVAKGESFMPAALASMLAKYLREISMLAWNSFWQRYIPNLQPTAGYPVDAIRFRAAIAATAQELQLPEELWWRNV